MTQTIAATLHTDGDQNAAKDAVSLTVPVTEACIVPALKGASLAAARSRLRNASCKLGRVKRLRRPRSYAHVKAKQVVVKTSRKTGKTAAIGAKVGVTLGWVRKR